MQEKEKQERLIREEFEKKRKYEEDLRNLTERGEKFEFTPNNSTKLSIIRRRDKGYYK